MASPGKSSDKQAASQRQETGESSGAGGNESPTQQQTESAPVPPPTQQVQGGDTVTVAVTGTQTEEFPVTRTGTVTIVVPSEGGSSRKRERTEAGGSSSGGAAAAAGERRQKRRSELIEVPQGPPVCYVCHREFQSWKAVFGHMRAHKVGEARTRPGAFPPPVFTPPGSPEREQQALEQQLAPTLLNIAQEMLTRPQESGAGSSSSAVPARPHIDLNVAHQPSPSPSAEAAPEPEPSSPSTSGEIDLNKPPKNGGDSAGAN